MTKGLKVITMEEEDGSWELDCFKKEWEDKIVAEGTVKLQKGEVEVVYSPDITGYSRVPFPISLKVRDNHSNEISLNITTEEAKEIALRLIGML